MAEKKRLRLTDRQCSLFVRDIREFGYPVTFDEVRRIADDLADGVLDRADPVAVILSKQIDEGTGGDNA